MKADDSVDALLKPAPACVLCSRTLEEVGGKRIASTQTIGVTRQAEERDGDEYQSHSLGVGAGYAITWGHPWTPNAVARAINAFQTGHRPWLCQPCANRGCCVCGSPLRIAMASDILHDDGDIRHHMIVPVRNPCSNPECTEFRPVPA